MSTLKMNWCKGIAVLCLLASTAVVHAQSITRGPYLQNSTETSVVVKWRTDSASDSQVDFGSAPGNLTQSVIDSASVTDHEVTVSGLAPNTLYYYQVGSTSSILAGDDSAHSFKTNPVIGSQDPINVWVLGDSGNSSGASRTYSGFKKHYGTNPVDVWLFLGDNAYNGGSESEYDASVFNKFTEHLTNTTAWSTRGNHETNAGVHYGIFAHPTNGEAGGVASGSEAYYSFDYGNAHFICLDSQATNRAVGGAMHNWMLADLADTDADWIIEFWHHPAYSHGTHNSDSETRLVEMRQNFVPDLEDAGVDIVLSGHSHGYERSFLIDSHYGNAGSFTEGHKVDGGSGEGSTPYTKNWGPHNGAVYTTMGNSSYKETYPNYDHPAMYMSSGSWLGSNLLTIAGDTVTVKQIDHRGVIRDEYSIVKNIGGPDLSPPFPNPAGFASAPSADGETSISMTATTGSDPSGPVEYLFLETSGNPGATSSAWQTSTSYTDSGLTESTQYTYTVTMRDALANMGSASAGASATTDTAPPADDFDAPTPSPMSFSSAPAANGSTSITMTATAASDPSGVEYYFTNTSGAGNDSGWQDSRTYVDAGLTADTSYAYTVTARDKSANQNATAASGAASATTDAAGCGATDLHVSAIAVWKNTAPCYGGGIANATVTILDDCGNPVANALVDITFTGDWTATFTNVSTNGNGQVSVQGGGCVKGNKHFTATVTDVTHGSLPYDSNDNVVTSATF